MNSDQYTTVVAVIGRPNAGKSTLINALVGQKIAITSHRPQTTRHRINAILTRDDYQYIFIDTPGINQTSNTVFLKELNKTTRSALSDTDIILFMLDGLTWDKIEDVVLRYFSAQNKQCIAIINKSDRYKKQKSRLIAFMQDISSRYKFSEIIPLSCRKKKDIIYLEKVLKKYAVKGEFMFPAEQCTDQNMRFYVSELIREKILRRYNQEIPYSAAVTVDSYDEKPRSIRIVATIHVEQKSHKKIIIGARGHGVREIGMQTRQQLEKETGTHVDIRLWVKVSKSWSTNPRLLRDFGYESS